MPGSDGHRDHASQENYGVRTERSVLPKIDVAFLYGRILHVQQQHRDVQHSEGVHVAAAQYNQSATTSPTAAAGQLPRHKQRSPRPPPFRAGLARHRALKGSQLPQPAAGGDTQVLTPGSASDPSGSSISAAYGPPGNTELAVNLGMPFPMERATSALQEHSAMQLDQQKQLLPHQHQHQQRLHTQTGATYRSHGSSLHRQVRGSNTGYGSSSNSSLCPKHPVVGSQGLAQALAAGYGQQALDSLACQSLAMLPAQELSQVASAAAGQVPAGFVQLSSRCQKDGYAACGNNSRKLRRTGDARTTAACASPGSVTCSRPGSSWQPTSRRSGVQPRAMDERSEDFPSLDSPVIQPGFSLSHVAASLGQSIQQLRLLELQQLHQQQSQHSSQMQAQPLQDVHGQRSSGAQGLRQVKVQQADPGPQATAKAVAGQRRQSAAAGRGTGAVGGNGSSSGNGSQQASTNSIGTAQSKARQPATVQQPTKTIADGVRAASAAIGAAGGAGKRGARGSAAASGATAAEVSGRAAAIVAADAGGSGVVAGQQQHSQGPATQLQLRALAASSEVVGSHTKAQLLLTHAFDRLAAQQQQQPGPMSATLAPLAASQSSSISTTAAVVAAAAAAGGGGATMPRTLQGPSIDPVLAAFGGRRSPARDMVLRASWDKQQQWQRQQERLQPGWRGVAAGLAGTLGTGMPTETGTRGGAGGVWQHNRLTLTPEPYLHSHRAGEEGWQAGSTHKTPTLPPLERAGAASPEASGAAGWMLQQVLPAAQDPAGIQRGRTGALLQQLASSMTKAVNLQASASAAAGLVSSSADAAGEGQYGWTATATTLGPSGAARQGVGGSSPLGLKVGEVEGLIVRYQQQGDGQSLDYSPATFNLDHALASRQQVQVLATALPQCPDLRLLLLRNNGLKDHDVQILAAALLNPACCSICGLDLGFNKLGPEAPLLLLPLLHQPPQMLLQARRRSAAEPAAGDPEGSGQPNLSASGCKALSVVGTTTASQASLSGPPAHVAAAATISTSGTGAAVWCSTDTGISGSGSGSSVLVNGALKPHRQQQLSLPQPLAGMAHSMLLQLVLCNNQIGDEGAQVVCKLVGTGDCLLQLLDLSCCGLTERLAGCLKGMLEGARQMKVLRLGWNRLGPKGGKALAEGLKYCSSGLEQLYIPWSGITDTGASHIVKALESNSSVRLVDLSGCQVSAGTCVVMAETLSINTSLDAIILHDNPLGAFGVQKLLKAVHEGHVRHVDIAGCSFLAAPTCQPGNGNNNSSAHPDASKSSKGKTGKKAKQKGGSADKGAAAGQQADSAASRKAASAKVAGGTQGTSRGASGHNAAAGAAGPASQRQIRGQAGSAAAAFSVREPDGCYTLELSIPSDCQVAVELLKLTELHGLDAWVNPTLNKKAYSIAGVTKQSLPSQGLLSVTFVAKHKLSWEAEPLTDPEFHSLWTQQVQPRATPSRPSLLLQQQQPEVLIASSQCTGPGFRGGQGLGLESSWAGNGMRMWAVPDGWKLELLQVLMQDCYFTSAQAGQIVAAFSYGEDKVEAAVKVFGRVVDPENFADQAFMTMNAWQIELADRRIGCLKLFSPDNPTGKYSLLLSHPAQRLVGARLVELFCQQHIDGRCSFPHSICFTAASLDDKPLPADMLQDPLRIRLPRSGIFKVCFVDLRPVPREAKPVSPQGFAVVLSMLTSANRLDGWELGQAVDAADLATKVSVVSRFDTWFNSHGPFTGKVGALRRLQPDSATAVAVKDMAGFVEAMHIFAIRHFLMGSQLQELIKLLPDTDVEQRVELCSRFWARLTDRAMTWSDVMRALTSEQQVTLAHRLGVANVFDPVRPSMHYKLRMWRADEHQIAWRLHRMALNATHDAFIGFAIDGQSKKIAQSANLWTLMRGNAADTDTPTVTLDFDFTWQDNLLPSWAAVTIQSAWRAYLIRKAAPPVLRQRLESLCGKPQLALGVRASIAGGKASLLQQRQPSHRDGLLPLHRSATSQADPLSERRLSLFGCEQLQGTSQAGQSACSSVSGRSARKVGQADWDPLLKTPHSVQG